MEPPDPSTVRRWPVAISSVAPATPTTAGIPYSRATTAPCDHADEPRHDPAGSREQQPLERVHALDSGRIGPELNASDVLNLPDDPLARVPGAREAADDDNGDAR